MYEETNKKIKENPNYMEDVLEEQRKEEEKEREETDKWIEEEVKRWDSDPTL